MLNGILQAYYAHTGMNASFWPILWLTKKKKIEHLQRTRLWALLKIQIHEELLVKNHTQDIKYFASLKSDKFRLKENFKHTVPPVHSITTNSLLGRLMSSNPKYFIVKASFWECISKLITVKCHNQDWNPQTEITPKQRTSIIGRQLEDGIIMDLHSWS